MRLLERLRHGACFRRAQPHPDALRDSILDHLRRVLNTRRGHAPLDPAFGLPVELLSNATASARLATDVARLITRYEPRLLGVRVTPHEAPPPLHGPRFTIEGRLTGTGTVIEATTRMTASGCVILEIPRH